MSSKEVYTSVRAPMLAPAFDCLYAALPTSSRSLWILVQSCLDIFLVDGIVVNWEQ